MYAKSFYALASAFAVLACMPAGGLGAAIHSTIQSRQLSSGTTFTGQATSVSVAGGEDACNQIHADSDLVASIPGNLFTLGICGAQITVKNTLTGQTGTFTVQDQCSTCGGQDLTLSPGAFQQIAGVGQTTLDVTWSALPFDQI